MKRILMVGDLHCGCNSSIMPKVVKETFNGEVRYHYPNDLQKEIYGCWKKMVKDVGRVDCVFNMGDNIEGINYHGGGVGNWCNNYLTQVDAAVELLDMIKCKHHEMVVGSRYHVGGNPSAEEAIAIRLRALNRVVSVGRDLIVKIGGKVFHLLHNVGYTSNPSYRGTPLSRELMFALMREQELHGAKYIVRGHTHYYLSILGYNSGACIVPSWKLQDDFLKRGSLGGSDMRIGYVLCSIDGDKVHFDYNGLKFKTQSEVVDVK